MVIINFRQTKSMYHLAICFLLLLVSCTAPKNIISYTSRTIPIYAVDPPPQKIILLNNYDVAAKKYRDNKEQLFLQLIDTMMYWASKRINDNTGIETEVIRGYTPAYGDSTIFRLIADHKATHAITVSNFDVSFEQTRVDVTKDNSGSKSREAYYDIVADISYSLYAHNSLIKQRDLHQSRFHSSRSVASGLLAAGPNIVVKKDDAYRIVMEIWQQYLNYFFPGEKVRSRSVFINKGFESVGQAISRQDYEAALTESLRFIDDPDKTKAAKACYNCAVFFERKNQPEEAKKYLRQSFSLATLSEAQQMRHDFE
jgi:hypothetical protein